MIRGARIGEDPPPRERPAAYLKSRPAPPAAREAGQEILALPPIGRPSPQVSARPSEIRRPRPRQPRVRGLPQLVGEDPQARVLDLDPFARIADGDLDATPLVPLLRGRGRGKVIPGTRECR